MANRVTDDLPFLSVSELTRLFRSRAIAPSDVLEAQIERIDRFDARLRSYVNPLTEGARETAKAMEQLWAVGIDLGPLQGITVSTKDNIWVRGVPTAAGSRIYADLTPEEDAAVVNRLRRGGALLLGKTRMYELAGGSPDGAGDPNFVKNPWNPARMTGGSSSGSAVAVAAGLCTVSIASDSAGSIRVPSGFCGVTGFKPTLGLIDTTGLIPYSTEMDTIGVLARSAEDVGLALQPLTDSGSKGPLGDVGPRPRSLRFGIPSDATLDVVAPDVQRVFDAAVHDLQTAGHHIVSVTISSEVHRLQRASSTLIRAQVAATYRRELQEKWGRIGDSLRRRLEPAQEVSASEYVELQRDVARFGASLLRALGSVDLLVLPTTPVGAPVVNLNDNFSRSLREHSGRSQQDLLSCFTIIPSVLGWPAITVPSGFDDHGLPVGLQFIGKTEGDHLVLAAGRSYQLLSDWHLQRPSLDALDGP